jgi:hypothetical protein
LENSATFRNIGTISADRRLSQIHRTETAKMRMRSMLTAVALTLIAPAAFAQGVSNEAPGQQPKGTHNSPGASYNAPGQEMRRDAPNPNPGSPGASGYAPGQSSTTGAATKKNGVDHDTPKSKSK